MIVTDRITVLLSRTLAVKGHTISLNVTNSKLYVEMLRTLSASRSLSVTRTLAICQHQRQFVA